MNYFRSQARQDGNQRDRLLVNFSVGIFSKVGVWFHFSNLVGMQHFSVYSVLQCCKRYDWAYFPFLVSVE